MKRYRGVGGRTAHQKELDQPNVWDDILSQRSKAGTSSQGSVIMLGGDKCGKTMLFNKMCKSERQSYSSSLEYGFLTIQSDLKSSPYQLAPAAFRQDSINLPVWMLGGFAEYVPLLKFAMPRELSKCCFVLMAPIVPPEDILPSLKMWYKVVVECIGQNFTSEQIESGKQAQICHWKEYIEPSGVSGIEDEVLEFDPHSIDLDPNALGENCGASIVVVLTKSDLYTELNIDQLNKIQYHVRKFCQERGAALVYTSARDDKNAQLLSKYLAHRVYGLPFTSSAYIVERDLIFIPSGWETNQKLEIISEMLTDASLPATIAYEMNYENKENVVIEDEQTFLSKLAALETEPMSSSPASDQGSTSEHSLTPQSLNSSRVYARSPLVNFFDTLLSGNRSNTTTPAVVPQAQCQKILIEAPKKASGLGNGDESPRGSLTTTFSAAVLSDQDADDLSDTSTAHVPSPRSPTGNEENIPTKEPEE